jgi:hypothetical protein
MTLVVSYTTCVVSQGKYCLSKRIPARETEAHVWKLMREKFAKNGSFFSDFREYSEAFAPRSCENPAKSAEWGSDFRRDRN